VDVAEGARNLLAINEARMEVEGQFKLPAFGGLILRLDP
jgi:hypothetical protein